MPNRYPGICYKCGAHVEPGEGVFEKVGRRQREKWPDLSKSIQWQVQHHSCARRYGRTAHHIHNPQPPLADRGEADD